VELSTPFETCTLFANVGDYAGIARLNRRADRITSFGADPEGNAYRFDRRPFENYFVAGSGSGSDGHGGPSVALAVSPAAVSFYAPPHVLSSPVPFSSEKSVLIREKRYLTPVPYPRLTGSRTCDENWGMAKRGRPYTIDRDAIRPQLIEDLRLGMPFRFVADGVNISEPTLVEWIQGDDELAIALKNAVTEGIRSRLKIVDAGGPQWTAAAWRLERRYPEHFGRQDRAALEVKDLAAKLGKELGLSAEESSRAVREAEAIAAEAMRSGAVMSPSKSKRT